jgi:hypothetical protein
MLVLTLKGVATKDNARPLAAAEAQTEHLEGEPTVTDYPKIEWQT